MNAKDLTEYVANVLQAQYSIVCSWGAWHFVPIVPDNPQCPNGAGLQFEVQGFKFTGTVQIIYKEGADVFHVSFWKDGKKVDENGDVYVDELVPYIDERVEMVDGYEQRVKEEHPEYFNPDGTPKELPTTIVVL